MSTNAGDRIRELREKRGLTQGQLADAVGTSANQLSKWERNEVLPRSNFIVPLADALQTTADVILRNHDDLPKGLAEFIAGAARLWGTPLSANEIEWCRNEVRAHGDVPAMEWAVLVGTKRRGLTPEQLELETATTKAAAAKGTALGVKRRQSR